MSRYGSSASKQIHHGSVYNMFGGMTGLVLLFIVGIQYGLFHVTLILMKIYGHKKRVNALTQPFVNLKSNTMKNTMQRYGFLSFLQINGAKTSDY